MPVLHPPRSRARLSRRQVLGSALGLSLAAFLAACSKNATSSTTLALPAENAQQGGALPVRGAYADNLDALYDVLIPAEKDASGGIVSPGAREAGADKVLRITDFVPLAIAQGLLPALSDAQISALQGLGDAFRAALNLDLDVLALVQRPLTAFRDLPRDQQEAAIVDAFADPVHKPALMVVRAACFIAYLGAVESDVGLVAVGFPPFENFADGLAVSGYPRTRSGRLIDAATEDLAKLAAANDLDDYTYNRAPAATDGDDLSLAIDLAGDLL